MSCPAVIKVVTPGPPGIGLPAGAAGDIGKYLRLRRASGNPYDYELVTPDAVGLPQALGATASPVFAGLTISGLPADRLVFTGAGGALQGLTLGAGLSIVNGALVAAGGVGGGSGTVTSVGLTVPTGFAVAGSPITSSGTLALTFAAGYSLPTISSQASWDAAAGLAATAVQPGALASGLALKADLSDARFTDSREWSAATISQAEAEAGTATTRRAFTAQRVFQAIAAWWAASSDKTKLDGIQAGAEVNVNADWNAGSGDAQILNKPLIPAPADAVPLAPGTAAVGTSTEYAREDHVHPLPGVVSTSAAGLVPSAGTPGGDRLFFWDHSAQAYVYATIGPGVVMDGTTLRAEDNPWMALGDEPSAATAGVKMTVRHWPQAHRLTAIPLWESSAPVGSALQIDIRVGGTSIFSTLPMIAVGGVSSTATTPAVFSTAFVSGGQTIAAGSTVTFHVTQAPSGGGGAGLKVQMPAVRV